MILDQAVELSAIANDIGSVRRDRPEQGGSQELNLIWSAAAESGSVDREIARAIHHYNDKVSLFGDTARNLAARDDPCLAEYVGLLSCMVDGNLEGTRILVGHRYPGAKRHLSALHTISGGADSASTAGSDLERPLRTAPDA